MSKLKKRRRNGKVIKVGSVTQRLLSKEAHTLIKEGRATELYDGIGKIKKKYLNIITQKFK